MEFPFYYQINKTDCGPACLQMIASFFGKEFDEEIIRHICQVSTSGTSFENLGKAAEYLGLKTLVVRIPIENLMDDVQLPCIALWNRVHFVVIYKITKNSIYVANPSSGKKKYKRTEFRSKWALENGKGILMLMEPDELKSQEKNKSLPYKKVLPFLKNYLKNYKFLFYQLVLGLAAGSVIQLFFPILTQLLVDKGINGHDVSFILLLLIGQIALFLGQSAVNIIKSWILLHIGSRFNMHIIYELLNKLSRLNIKFFETRKVGEIFQRIFDNRRIESFVTNSLISTVFSFINLVVFGVVLALYSIKILLIFIAGSLLTAAWLIFFLKKRREIDNRFFSLYSENNNKIFQLIWGVRDIKLNSAEKKKIYEWEKVQASLFAVQTKSLKYSQYQQIGSASITQLKNIIITFVAALSVINNEITLGMMMAMTFIAGQLNVPIEQLVNFTQSAQDAGLSIERLTDINNQKEEYGYNVNETKKIYPCDIRINNIRFKYNENDPDYVIKDMSLKIEKGKITAIVGSSGSGKTTLLKLILKFYELEHGSIQFDNTDINKIDILSLRENCGIVMQDSYIFSDTILGNIALSGNNVDWPALDHAAKTANIFDFIQSLPYKYYTKIGKDEKDISQGQKQRILIARAIYKNPSIILLDEATNALDTNNESMVMNNLNHFFRGKTVVVVAHRLSTVMNADKIIVMENGEIVESGNHSELVNNRKNYYSLIKNQLELNNGINV